MPKRTKKNRPSKSLVLILGLGLAASSVVPTFADTAGSGACTQTFTPSGNGTASVAVLQSGGFCYVAFRNTGTPGTQSSFSWTRPANVTSANVLVVGGGGGGGSRHGGGGGAGALVEATAFNISSASTITVAVGAGGTGGTESTFVGTNGQNSTFLSGSNGLTALGGGFGANAASAGTGGSGGGAGAAQTVGNVQSQSQTNFSGSSLTGITFGSAGANGANDTDSTDYWAGGGGGGAGGAGSRPTQNGTLTSTFSTGTQNVARGGNGGAGRDVSSWLPAAVASSLSVGQVSGSQVFFAGGGGGGMGADGLAGGTGGVGGGANGSRYELTPNNGLVSTGGGGGGSGFDDSRPADRTSNNAPAGAGGSGVVIVRYQIPPNAPTISSLTPGNQQLTVNFTAPTSNGATISDYQYSIDGGANWTSAGTTSPFTIAGLTNEQSYTVTLRALNGANASSASSGVSSTPRPVCNPATSSTPSLITLRFTDTTATCNWFVPNGVTQIEVGLVGGGGGGAFSNNAGGGGAGEVLVFGSASLSSGTVSGASPMSVSAGQMFAVRVGSGGTSGAPTGSTETNASTAWTADQGSSRPGGDGNNTIFGSVTAKGGGGGGGGGTVVNLNGATGGSGGGGASGGTGGLTGSVATYSGWTSFKNNGANGATGGGGGAGSAGSSSRGGSGLTLFGIVLAGGGGGWGGLGSAGSATDTVLGGNGRLTTGTWGYTGSEPNYTSPGTANTGTGGGAGAPGGSGVVIVRFAPVAPSAPTITNVDLTATSAALTWNAPTNTGTSPITNYSFEYSLDHGSTWSTVTRSASNSTSHTISGLTIDPKGYTRTQFRVYAISDAGTSTASTAVNARFFSCGVDPSPGLDSRFTRIERVTLLTFVSIANCNVTYTQNGFVPHYPSSAPAGQVNRTFSYDPNANSSIASINSYIAGSHGNDWTFHPASANPGLTPEFSNLTSGPDSATVQITNYDATASYTANTNGQCLANIDSTGFVTALKMLSQSCTVRIQVTKSGVLTTSSTFFAIPGTGGYTVVFNPGTGVGTPMANLSASSSTSLSANTYTRANSNFAGWSTTSGGALAYEDLASYPFTSSAILYARWSNVTYPVTYNINGATGGSAPATQNKIHGTALSLATNSGSLARTGYTWAGWNTQADGLGTNYASGSSYTLNAQVELFAKWDSTLAITTPTSPTKNLTATFGQNYSLNVSDLVSGGAGTRSFSASGLPSGLSMDSGTGVISGTASTLGNSSATVTVTDSTGSKTSSSFTISVQAQKLSVPTDLAVSATSGTLKSLTVTWSAVANANDYMVKLYNAAGTTNHVNLIAAGNATSMVISSAHFGSMVDNTTYQVAIIARGTGNYSNSDESSKVSATTLASYAVTYNSNSASGGSAPSAQTKIMGTNLVLASNSGNLSRTGYSFVGWNTQANGQGVDYATGATYSLNQSLALFAKWETTLTISTPTTGLSGFVGQSYTLAITASGGSGTKTYSATGLPNGLSINTSNGTISGTPTSSGDATVTVTVSDAVGGSRSTNSFNISVGLVPLSNIGNPTVSATSGVSSSISVSWTAVANASSYTLKLYSSDGSTLLQTLTGVSGTSTTINSSNYSSIAAGTAYQVSIQAIGGNEYASSAESQKMSVTTSTRLAVPTSRSASSEGASVIRVLFNNVTNASSYTVQLFDADGNQIGSNYTSFLGGGYISGLSPNTTYRLKVTAVGNGTTFITSDASPFFDVTTGSASYLNFPGTTDKFASTSNAVLPATGNFTAEAWISPSDYSATRSAATILSQGTITKFYLRLNSTGQLVVFRDSGSEVICSTTPIPKDVWSHVAVVVSGTTATCYVNGQVRQSGTIGDATIAQPFYIGGYSANPTDTSTIFAGAIDDVKVWNVARTATQILNNMEVDPSIQDSTVSAFYTFDLTSSQQATSYKFVSRTVTFASTMTWSPLVRTITYKAGTSGSGSDLTDSTASNHASTLTIRSDSQASSLTRTNYTMTGWNTLANGSGDSYSFGSTYSGIKSLTLHAQWLAPSSTVTFNANDGSGTPATSTQSITQGIATALTANAFTRTGYTFAGWNTLANGNGDNYSNQQSVTISGSLTLYAKWTANTYTVTYDYNGADGGTRPVTNSFTVGGSTITLPTPTKTGYTFDGWFAEVGLSTSIGSAGASFSPTGNVTIYARWAANNNTVTFKSNYSGGAGDTTQTIVSGSATSLTSNSFTRTGYTFAGWNTLADGTGTNYTNGQSVTITGALTLYAKWTAATYTITYSYNSATGGASVASGTFTTGGTELLLPTPTRTGYTFAGWYDDSGFSGSSLASSISTTSSKTIYAKWTPATFTVLYEYNGATGSNTTTSSTYTTASTTITLPTPTRTGYTFAGWFESVGLTGSAVTTPYTTSQNRTLYAKWTAVNYTVTYNADLLDGGNTIFATSGSAPVNNTNYNIGQSFSVSANTGSLARTGYTFGGWVTNADGSGTAKNSGETITFGAGNINLYPKWNPDTYTIAYNLSGGSGDLSTAPNSWTVGNADVTLPSSGFTKTGYNFGGWSRVQGGAAVNNSFSNFGNITLHAVWTIKSINYSYAKGTANGLTIANWPSNGSANFGSTITLPDLTGTTVTISGGTYLFFGWSGGGTTYSAGSTFILGETAPTFTAEWVQLFDVRYAFAGGTHATAGDTEEECVTSNLCVNNQNITLRTAPTRTGYTFDGWKVQTPSGVTKAGAAAHTITSTAYLFYASWTAVDYDFGFNSMGGSNNHVNVTRNIGQLVTMPNPGSKTGYTFAGWSPDGGSTKYSIGSTFLVGTESKSFIAQWTPNVYTVVFDWQGATGTPSPNASYTVGTGTLSLPVIGDRTKDGYTFGGWSESPGGPAVSNFVPTSNDVLYAIWNDGNYSLSYDGQGGTIGSGSGSVSRGQSVNLPTPVRAGFVFNGWYDSANAGNKVGNGGQSHTPTRSKTMYARWVQKSLWGVDPAKLESANEYTASDNTAVDITLSHNTTGTSARVKVPSGALPNGTKVNVQYFKDTERQSQLIPGDNSYFFSVLVSWLSGSGSSATVPNTNAGKPIEVTLTNSSIRAGAMVYMVIGDQVTELGRATQNGTVTVELTEDPEIVVAATAPSSPSSVVATAGNQQATVSWAAPSTNGGAQVTGYTVTANPGGATCTTATTSCAVTGLTNGTSYTFSVVATNSVGSSSPATSSSVTPALATYTVTFNSNGGSSVYNGSFPSGGSVAEPTAPTRSGYTFDGWSTTQNNVATKVTFPYSPGVTNNITLYALWVQAQSGGGGSGPAPTQTPSLDGPVGSVIGSTEQVIVTSDELKEKLIATAGVWRLAIHPPVLPRHAKPVGQSLDITMSMAARPEVVGNGLQPNSLVEVRVQGQSALIDSVRVGADGTVSERIKLTKDLLPGKHVLQIDSINAQGRAIKLSIPMNIRGSITVGTFRGFVAIFGKDLEGQELTSRVAGKWIRQNPITNFKGNNYSRMVRFTGAGYDIVIDVYINKKFYKRYTTRTR